LPNTPASRLTSVSKELVVVFVGVLVALAADSWWEAQREASRVSTYLEALEHDLEEGRSALSGVIQDTQGYVEDLDVFLNVVRSTAPIPDSIGAMGFRTFVPHLPMGTLDALFATGDINLIDEPLRSDIVSGRASLVSLERQFDQFSDAEIDHLLARSIELERVNVEHRLRGERPTPPIIRQSSTLVGMYRTRHTLSENQLNLLREIRSQIDSLLLSLAGSHEGAT